MTHVIILLLDNLVIWMNAQFVCAESHTHTHGKFSTECERKPKWMTETKARTNDIGCRNIKQ